MNTAEDIKTGVIKFFDYYRGFGFVIDDDTHKDIFIHKTSLLQDVVKDERVTFSVKHAPDNRLIAIKVKPIQ